MQKNTSSSKMVFHLLKLSTTLRYHTKTTQTYKPGKIVHFFNKIVRQCLLNMLVDYNRSHDRSLQVKLEIPYRNSLLSFITVSTKKTGMTSFLFRRHWKAWPITTANVYHEMQKPGKWCKDCVHTNNTWFDITLL